MYKYYLLSKLNNGHVLGVIEETETTITVQKLKVDKVFDEFINNDKDEIVADTSSQEFNNRVISKDELSARFNDVEITKNHSLVFEYLTGKKRKAVSNSSEC